ncbi:MAG: hypothetical protein JNK27_11275 [Chitinophagaceae bacterium]|nr:hypothetical protein [Chitinophagaceae bacterium]
MKYLPLVFISVFTLTYQSCKQKYDPPSVKLNDLVFNSIFADNKKDSMHTYCLLGSGYFRAETSDDADSIINSWLSKHPNANVIPVATHGPTLSDYPNSKMTYCWLIDNNDTINNFLIRTGCYEGGTMIRPKTWQEMSNKEKTVWEKDPKIIVHIDQRTYDKFLDQIKAAEQYAKQHQLGIWNKKKEDEY